MRRTDLVGAESAVVVVDQQPYAGGAALHLAKLAGGCAFARHAAVARGALGMHTTSALRKQMCLKRKTSWLEDVV